MTDTFRFVMTEHAAWRINGSARYRAFALPDGEQWLVTVEENRPSFRPLLCSKEQPRPDVFVLAEALAIEVPALQQALTSLGPVARFRTSDLWEAIATAIIRQVIRAAQAKRLYRDFCAAYGERIVHLNGHGYAIFPAPETVLGLTDAQFASVGLTFKRSTLRLAAEAHLKHEATWRELPPDELVRQLQQIPRIGPWTAGAAVADFSNDFTYYPYADLAVRNWATRAAPSYSWPSDEQAFGRFWRQLGGDQLGILTLLTLAWGSQHGDTG